MNRAYTMLLAGVITTVALTGCAGVRRSITNIPADFIDIVRVDVSGSFGTDMGAHAMITQLIQLKSYSYEDLYRLGINGRMIGLWREDREDFWIGPLRIGRMWMNWKRVAIVPWTAMAGKTGAGRYSAMAMAAESADEIGVGAHLFVVGARVGIRPWEAVDFLANFIGLDPVGDNLTRAQIRILRMKPVEPVVVPAEPAKSVPE